jgi:hypothetical protein
MITFLTLFLGLTTGVHPVEVALDRAVSRVELRLDGAVVAAATEPPWRFEVDFGERLVPHRLAAVAFDARGRRVADAAQRVNLELSVAGARLVLERDAAGQAVAVRPVVTSILFDGASGVAVTFDGWPLDVVDPERVALPAHSPDSVHFVAAELIFPDGSTARADLAFGGVYGEEVSSENTAVAVEVERRRDLRRAGDARGLLLAGGEPARPLAVESDGADLVVVTDDGARAVLAELAAELDRPRREARPFAPGSRTTQDRVAIGAGLRRGDRLFFVRPWSEQTTPAGVTHFIFEVGEMTDREGRGLTWGVTHVEWGEPAAAQKLPDATALAGLHVAALKRPRAVLLVLGTDLGRTGRHSARQARELLRAVRVPLFVWYVGEPEPRGGARSAPVVAHRARRAERLAAARTLWGEVEDVVSLADLVRAAEALRREVGRQRVVWVDGAWLPREVTLAGGVGGVRFVE